MRGREDAVNGKRLILVRERRGERERRTKRYGGENAVVEERAEGIRNEVKTRDVSEIYLCRGGPPARNLRLSSSFSSTLLLLHLIPRSSSRAAAAQRPTLTFRFRFRLGPSPSPLRPR